MFSAALAGFVEATLADDATKNQLCLPNSYPDTAADWIRLTLTAQRAEIACVSDPKVSAWMQRSRLNGSRGIGDHHGDPVMQSALARLFANIEPAIGNLERLTPQAAAG